MTKIEELLNEIVKEREEKTKAYETKAREGIDDMLKEIEENNKKLIAMFKPLYDAFGKGKERNNEIGGPCWYIGSIGKVSYYYYKEYYNLAEKVDDYRDANTNNIRSLVWTAEQQLLKKSEINYKWVSELLAKALDKSRKMLEHADEVMFERIKAEIKINEEIGK